MTRYCIRGFSTFPKLTQGKYFITLRSIWSAVCQKKTIRVLMTTGCSLSRIPGIPKTCEHSYFRIPHVWLSTCWYIAKCEQVVNDTLDCEKRDMILARQLHRNFIVTDDISLSFVMSQKDITNYRGLELIGLGVHLGDV